MPLRVLDGHEGVPPHIATVFPGVPASVSAARRFVRSALRRRRVDPDVTDLAALLTSELVTNSYRHGGSEARVSLTCRDDALRVEVQDSGVEGDVRMRPADSESEGGRGLQIVDTLATRWGAAKTEAGTLVWFELGVPGRPKGQG